MGFCLLIEGVDFGAAAREIVSATFDEFEELAAVELVVL